MWLPLLLLAAPPPMTVGRPNVVFILADDLGFGDLACYGHPYAKTPHLDKLAAAGTRFEGHCVTGITCCPSRTGFLTGRFPARFAKDPAGYGFGDRTTVMEVLKTAGYATGHFGKWHIGPTAKPGVYGLDAVGHDDPDQPRKKRSVDGRDAGLFAGAIRFIEQNKGRPFYVNVWGHITHYPVNPAQKFADRFRGLTVREADFGPAMALKFGHVRELGRDVSAGMRNYLGDVSSLDDEVGRLLAKLDELKLRDNTLVVFSSDHGPAPVKLASEKKVGNQEFKGNMLGSPGPFRGGKHTMLEGGVRVPFVVRGPGVPAGRVDRDSVLSGADWLPTVAALAGVGGVPTDLDGEDASAAWRGGTHVRAKPLFWKVASPAAPVGVRDGNWKLYAPTAKRGTLELFDVVADPGETRDLSGKHPDVVAALRPKVDAFNRSLPASYAKSGQDD
jgi:N-acetylgalactosamine-6-sulfatase